MLEPIIIYCLLHDRHASFMLKEGVPVRYSLDENDWDWFRQFGGKNIQLHLAHQYDLKPLSAIVRIKERIKHILVSDEIDIIPTHLELEQTLLYAALKMHSGTVAHISFRGSNMISRKATLQDAVWSYQEAGEMPIHTKDPENLLLDMIVEKHQRTSEGTIRNYSPKDIEAFKERHADEFPNWVNKLEYYDFNQDIQIVPGNSSKTKRIEILKDEFDGRLLLYSNYNDFWRFLKETLACDSYLVEKPTNRILCRFFEHNIDHVLMYDDKTKMLLAVKGVAQYHVIQTQPKQRPSQDKQVINGLGPDNEPENLDTQSPQPVDKVQQQHDQRVDEVVSQEERVRSPLSPEQVDDPYPPKDPGSSRGKSDVLPKDEDTQSRRNLLLLFLVVATTVIGLLTWALPHTLTEEPSYPSWWGSVSPEWQQVFLTNAGPSGLDTIGKLQSLNADTNRVKTAANVPWEKMDSLKFLSFTKLDNVDSILTLLKLPNPIGLIVELPQSTSSDLKLLRAKGVVLQYNNTSGADDLSRAKSKLYKGQYKSGKLEEPLAYEDFNFIHREIGYPSKLRQIAMIYRDLSDCLEKAKTLRLKHENKRVSKAEFDMYNKYLFEAEKLALKVDDEYMQIMLQLMDKLSIPTSPNKIPLEPSPKNISRTVDIVDRDIYISDLNDLLKKYAGIHGATRGLKVIADEMNGDGSVSLSIVYEAESGKWQDYQVSRKVAWKDKMHVLISANNKTNRVEVRISYPKNNTDL